MEFVLHWTSGRADVITGNNIREACHEAGFRRDQLANLNFYQTGVDGPKTYVAGAAPCGCVYHAEEEQACDHDLVDAGILEPEVLGIEHILGAATLYP